MDSVAFCIDIYMLAVPSEILCLKKHFLENPELKQLRSTYLSVGYLL